MKPLFDLLESVGAEITYLEQEGHLPARIRGREAGGVSAGPQAQPPLAVSLDITDSTQFLRPNHAKNDGGFPCCGILRWKELWRITGGNLPQKKL